MQGNTFVKLLIAAVIAFAIWKKGIPWWNARHVAAPSDATTSASKANASCIPPAEAASRAWGSGLGRFANPPYDLAAWGDFQSSIDSKIRTAEEKCSCGDDSCAKAREAMTELRTVLNETDSSIRGNGPPPSDLVQRQERIDNALDAAREMVRQGK